MSQRVLFVSSLLAPWGGSEVMWYKTAKLCLDNQDKVLISIYKQNKYDKRIEELIQLGCDFQKRPNDVLLKNAGILRKFFYRVNKRLNGNGYIKQIQRFNPDKIIISLSNTFDCVWHEQIYHIIEKFNSKVILQSNFHNEHLILSYMEFKKARIVFDVVNQIIFASRRNKEMCEHQIAQNLDNKKVQVVRAPVNFQINGIVSIKQNNDKVRFCIMSRFDVELKGHDLVFKLLANEKWRKRPWQLNLYGEGNDFEYLQALLEYYQLSDKIIFKGHSNNLIKEWEENDILIMPSFAEGTPIVLMIAMLCGRAAVVTDVAGNTELIKDNETGFVAKAPTPELIDEALERAWQRRTDWETMGQNAHNWAMQNLDLEPEKTLYNLLTKLD